MEGGPPTFRQDFSCPALLKDLEKTLPVRGYHPLWPAFPDRSGCFLQATGLVRVRSPLLTESRLMSFPPATEMFQFAGFAPQRYVFTLRYRRSGGLPHSEILGSKLTGSSPRLNAACHVLHRLSMPRHPPNALQTLDHTQPHAGNKGRMSEVRFQMSELWQLKQPRTRPNPAHENSCVSQWHDGVAQILERVSNQNLDRTTIMPPTKHTRDRQKTCQQRRHGSP